MCRKALTTQRFLKSTVWRPLLRPILPIARRRKRVFGRPPNAYSIPRRSALARSCPQVMPLAEVLPGRTGQMALAVRVQADGRTSAQTDHRSKGQWFPVMERVRRRPSSQGSSRPPFHRKDREEGRSAGGDAGAKVRCPGGGRKLLAGLAHMGPTSASC